MELPEIAKRMGKIESKRNIFIEDYVVGFLECFKIQEGHGKQVILYGRKLQNNSEENFIVYGAAERIDEEIKQQDNIFKEYEEIGCLNMEIWRDSKSMCEGILMGDGSGGQPIEGYYIFYDNASVMKEYLSMYYEKTKKRNIRAELVALSNEEVSLASPLYDLVRILVIFIFIFFCAIAVTTVNSFDKIDDFNRTAVQMQEALEQP